MVYPSLEQNLLDKKPLHQHQISSTALEQICMKNHNDSTELVQVLEKLVDSEIENYPSEAGNLLYQSLQPGYF
jgi:hypothetical protein